MDRKDLERDMRMPATADTKEDVERIREKQGDGATLTRSEEDILEGASRAKE